MFCFYHAFLSVHCSLVVTCWEGADLLPRLREVFCCVLVDFLCGVFDQMGCLIVSIPDFCLLTYFNKVDGAYTNDEPTCIG